MIGIRTCSFCLVLLVLLVCIASNVEGRYLPTRSDNSRYERIKEVLRALIELNNETEMQNGKANYAFEDVYRAKRSSQNPLSPASLPRM